MAKVDQPPSISKFTATIGSSKLFSQIMSCLAITANAKFTINQEGVHVCIEQSRSIEANAYLTRSWFEEYQLDTEEDIQFSVDLKSLDFSLRLFGSSISPNVPSYMNENASNYRANLFDKHLSSSIIQLSFSDSTMKLSSSVNETETTCKILVFEAEEIVSLNDLFNDSELAASLIIKSEYLKSAFAELDETSESIQFQIQPNDPCLTISSTGLCGECLLEYDNDIESIQSFSCIMPISENYRFNLIKPCLKSLEISEKACLKFNSDGVLALQFLIHSEKCATDSHVFLEYIVLYKLIPGAPPCARVARLRLFRVDAIF